MKRTLIMLAFTVISISAHAQSLSGEFSKLDISGVYEVILTHSEQCSVEVVCTDKKLEGRLKMKIKDNTLILGVKNDVKRDKKRKLKAYVSMPYLSSVELSGTCSLKSDDIFEADELACDISGMSTIDIELKCRQLLAKASGMSDAKFRGKAQYAVLKASGMSSLKCDDMNIDKGEVSISGMSQISSNIENLKYTNVSGMSNYKNVVE